MSNELFESQKTPHAKQTLIRHRPKIRMVGKDNLKPEEKLLKLGGGKQIEITPDTLVMVSEPYQGRAGLVRVVRVYGNKDVFVMSDETIKNYFKPIGSGTELERKVRKDTMTPTAAVRQAKGFRTGGPRSAEEIGGSKVKKLLLKNKQAKEKVTKESYMIDLGAQLFEHYCQLDQNSQDCQSFLESLDQTQIEAIEMYEQQMVVEQVWEYGVQLVEHLQTLDQQAIEQYLQTLDEHTLDLIETVLNEERSREKAAKKKIGAIDSRIEALRSSGASDEEIKKLESEKKKHQQIVAGSELKRNISRAIRGGMSSQQIRDTGGTYLSPQARRNVFGAAASVSSQPTPKGTAPFKMVRSPVRMLSGRRPIEIPKDATALGVAKGEPQILQPKFEIGKKEKPTVAPTPAAPQSTEKRDRATKLTPTETDESGFIWNGTKLSPDEVTALGLHDRMPHHIKVLRGETPSSKETQNQITQTAASLVTPQRIKTIQDISSVPVTIRKDVPTHFHEKNRRGARARKNLISFLKQSPGHASQIVNWANTQSDLKPHHQAAVDMAREVLRASKSVKTPESKTDEGDTATLSAHTKTRIGLTPLPAPVPSSTRPDVGTEEQHQAAHDAALKRRESLQSKLPEIQANLKKDPENQELQNNLKSVKDEIDSLTAQAKHHKSRIKDLPGRYEFEHIPHEFDDVGTIQNAVDQHVGRIRTANTAYGETLSRFHRDYHPRVVEARNKLKQKQHELLGVHKDAYKKAFENFDNVLKTNASTHHDARNILRNHVGVIEQMIDTGKHHATGKQLKPIEINKLKNSKKFINVHLSKGTFPSAEEFKTHTGQDMPLVGGIAASEVTPNDKVLEARKQLQDSRSALLKARDESKNHPELIKSQNELNQIRKSVKHNPEHPQVQQLGKYLTAYHQAFDQYREDFGRHLSDLANETKILKNKQKQNKLDEGDQARLTDLENQLKTKGDFYQNMPGTMIVAPGKRGFTQVPILDKPTTQRFQAATGIEPVEAPLMTRPRNLTVPATIGRLGGSVQPRDVGLEMAAGTPKSRGLVTFDDVKKAGDNLQTTAKSKLYHTDDATRVRNPVVFHHTTGGTHVVLHPELHRALADYRETKRAHEQQKTATPEEQSIVKRLSTETQPSDVQVFDYGRRRFLKTHKQFPGQTAKVFVGTPEQLAGSGLRMPRGAFAQAAQKRADRASLTQSNVADKLAFEQRIKAIRFELKNPNITPERKNDLQNELSDAESKLKNLQGVNVPSRFKPKEQTTDKPKSTSTSTDANQNRISQLISTINLLKIRIQNDPSNKETLQADLKRAQEELQNLKKQSGETKMESYDYVGLASNKDAINFAQVIRNALDSKANDAIDSYQVNLVDGQDDQQELEMDVQESIADLENYVLSLDEEQAEQYFETLTEEEMQTLMQILEAKHTKKMKQDHPKYGTKKGRKRLAKKIQAGEDIGKKGKGFEMVAKKAAERYGSEEAGKRVAAAAMWKKYGGKK
jgi:hypothetical protein